MPDMSRTHINKGTANEQSDVESGVSHELPPLHASEIPVDDLERINRHRLGIAKAIRRMSAKGVKRDEARRMKGMERRAKRYLKHPTSRQTTIKVAIVTCFVIVIAWSFAVGSGITKNIGKSASQNLEQTSTESLSVNRTQRKAILATGLYDTFMMDGNVRVADVLDGNVTASEYAKYKSILDARAAKEPASDDNDTTNANATNKNKNGNASQLGGQGTESGELTSEQENEGRQKVLDALNAYTNETKSKADNINSVLNSD